MLFEDYKGINKLVLDCCRFLSLAILREGQVLSRYLEYLFRVNTNEYD